MSTRGFKDSKYYLSTLTIINFGPKEAAPLDKKRNFVHFRRECFVFEKITAPKQQK